MLDLKVVVMTENCVWFTADHHFGHENIIKFCNRPFGTVAQMDRWMIDRWNERVEGVDTVYSLGDLTLSGVRVAVSILGQLNGQIKIVPGGHDRRWITHVTPGVVSRTGGVIEVLPPLVTLKLTGSSGDQLIVVLCHYSLRVWDRSHYGSWHLYGHSHGKLPLLKGSMDVGVDCNDFAPVSLNEVEVKLRNVAGKDCSEEDG